MTYMSMLCLCSGDDRGVANMEGECGSGRLGIVIRHDEVLSSSGLIFKYLAGSNQRNGGWST